MPAMPDAIRRAHRLPVALGIFAVVLAAACVAQLSGNGAWCVLAAMPFALGFALDRRWLRRASGKVALILTGGTIIAGAALGVSPAALAADAARMSDVVVLMLCIALLRPVFAERRLDETLVALLTRLPAALRVLAIVLAACVTALGLSFGTVGVFGASLGRRTVPEHVAPYATMRGVVLSMLLGPSTASVAAVMATRPEVSWGASLGLGLPLVAAGALLGSLLLAGGPLVVGAINPRPPGGLTAFLILLAQFLIAAIAHAALGLSTILAIAIASAAVAIACTLGWGRGDLGGALRQADLRMVETWHLIMPEAALFLASGFVLGLMQAPQVAAVARAAAMSTLPSGLWGVAAILTAVPLITAAGIHPIVPFALLSPAISSAALGVSEVGLYTMWIVAFMLSMLLSPVSILTMVTITNFGIPGRLLGLRAHGLYAAALAATSAVAIAFCCPR